MNKSKVLVVEDDKAVRNLITTTLELHGYQFYTARTGEEALLSATTSPPDILILDLGLPDMDGVEIIKKIRSWSNVPIIVVSARSEDSDKIDALDSGADDYLTKPFSVEELLARLRTALRRAHYSAERDESQNSIYENGVLRIDYAAGCTYISGQEIHLTPTEYKLICLFAKNTGKVMTHNYILREIWGNPLPKDTPSLRVFMASLRKKIESPSEANLIQTHIGVGYRMTRTEKKEEM